ncbi:MAG: HAMP domain-containing histidine kinase [Lachnospiraceae bacterium]|nr:HAMP domain-containing histidine kinase [Lachnospiraceae bacterium]
MEEKSIKTKKLLLLIAVSLLIPFMAMMIIMSTYGIVKEYAKVNRQNPFEYGESLKELLKGNYVLYKNLQEKLTGEPQQYSDLYITDIQGFTRSLRRLDGEYADTEAAAAYVKQLFDSVMKYSVENNELREFGIYDYYIEDLETGSSMSNTVTGILEKADYFYYLEILFDEKGYANIVDAQSKDTDLLIKNASDCFWVRNGLLEDYLLDSGYSMFRYNQYDIQQYGDGPRNCRIIYGITQKTWDQITQGELGGYFPIMSIYTAYEISGISNWILAACLFAGLFALFLPLQKLAGKSLSVYRIFRLPLELFLFLLSLLIVFVDHFVYEIAGLLERAYTSGIQNILGVSESAAEKLAWLRHGMLLYLLFLFAFYLGVCLRPLIGKGIKRYIQEYSLIYRFFPFCKRLFLKLIESWENIVVSKKVKRTILKIVIINALILFGISLLWVGGLPVTVVYSIVLYILLKVYVSRIQKKYQLLLFRIHQISEGNLNVEIKEDLGMFNPLKEELLTIQGGLKNAVEAETKSQRMKTELITNVSHDLKTPLTAITTYVDLMKDENTTEEQKREYLDILERKALRLKVLIEDLFEVSKATSGNVNLRYMNIDICHLVKQVRLEMSDKLEEAGLDIRMELPEEKVIVSLDSQKTYRIFENLFQNIVKYAMPGTRVYVQGNVKEGQIVISLKNISASEITMDVAELAERFVRGDSSRNTEGSGLGLAIAKSLTQLQGGEFKLESDGDLFKVILSFPCYGSL